MHRMRRKVRVHVTPSDVPHAGRASVLKSFLGSTWCFRKWRKFCITGSIGTLPPDGVGKARTPGSVGCGNVVWAMLSGGASSVGGKCVPAFRALVEYGLALVGRTQPVAVNRTWRGHRKEGLARGARAAGRTASCSIASLGSCT